VSQYAFIRYKMAGDLMGAKVITVPMKNYRHDLPAMLKAVTKNTKAIFIANPNNPTGTYNSAREVEAFLKGLSKKFGAHAPLVVLDEAYYEFASINADYPQTMEYLERFPNLIITRTFSKVYGLAGIRVGFGFASDEIAGFIDRVRPPFNINCAAQAAAVASLKDTAQVTKSVRLVEQQKKILYSAFLKLGLEYIPSAGNFILFRTRPFGSSQLFKLLLKKGVIVRAMDEYELPDWVRSSVGLPSENTFFIKKLTELFREGR
jgi:histidinol-phosphate aminotransferase